MNKITATGRYCMYLRRSRADVDEERRGAGETLARHYAMLTELAGRLGIHIAESAVYREIVSGDTIAARPQMQRLLTDVERGMWDGVLVTEMSRLARGDTMDQGVVANTFLYSNTLIITPQKTYDLRDQADEEMAEMGLFMSRFEYRQIKRRLQAGRVSSVKQGLYVGSRDPYGYQRYKLPQQRGYSLEIVPEQAAVVRMVFDWYLNGIGGRIVGCGAIAQRLNEMGFQTGRGFDWCESTVRHMLLNPTYCGKVWWARRVQTVQMQDGERVKARVPAEPIIADGVHEAIVSYETWEQAQECLKNRRTSPNTNKSGTRNPFAGILKCGVCGKAMVYWIRRRGNGRPDTKLLHCSTPHCATSGAYLSVVENVVLEQLASWVREFDREDDAEAAEIYGESDADIAIAAAEKNLATLNKQLSRLRDLLEQDVYTIDEYLERKKDLQTRIDETTAQIEALRAPAAISREDAIRANLPQIKSFLESYNTNASAEVKNKLLKSVIGRIVYHKTEKNKRFEAYSDKLTLDIYPIIPKDHSLH